VLSVAGAVCIVAGGLVAAVTGPLDLDHGSWVAAYLVLVGGVMQYVMGWSRDPSAPPSGRGWTAVIGWNVGNALVISGVLSDRTWLVDAGSVLLVLVLLIAVRDAVGQHGDRSAALAGTSVRTGYVALAVFVAASIPVGIVLAHLRH